MKRAGDHGTGPPLRVVVGVLLAAVGALVVATFSYVTLRTDEAGFAAQRESEIKLAAGQFGQAEVSVRGLLHQADAYVQIKDSLQAQNALQLVGAARASLAALREGGRAESTRVAAGRAFAQVDRVAVELQPVRTEEELRLLDARLARLESALGALAGEAASLGGQLPEERRAITEFYAGRIADSKRVALVMIPLALVAAGIGGLMFYRLVVAPLQELGQATEVALQPDGVFRLDPASPGCRELRQVRTGAYQLFHRLGGLVQERTARLEEALRQTAAQKRQLAEAEREARSSEARFIEVFRTTSSGLLLTDGTGRVVLANPAAEDILRTGQRQAVGSHLVDLLIGSGFGGAAAELRRFLALADPAATFRLERRGNGGDFFGELQLHDFLNGEVRGQLAQITDITQREKMLQSEFRTQRMESIGALASGIAHDLNNSLAPIMMAAEMLRLRHPDEQSLLGVIDQSSRRSAAMVKQLVSFAKGTPSERRAASSARVIAELAAMIRSTFTAGIQVETEVANDLPDVAGEPTQLFQVLLNLCVNARDAMPRGGRLRLAARARSIAPGEVFGTACPRPGRYVEWTVADTGSGMTPDVLARLFEPFFTTKGPEKGTGLGLATSLGIIRRSGGLMDVSSAPGQGSTFRILLPEAPREPAAARPAEPLPGTGADAPAESSGELILLVDDEAALRETTQLLLGGAGFAVETAMDGAHALRRLEELGRRVTLVITDANMPNIDGLQLVTELRRRRPGLPVIVCSGTLDDTETEGFRAQGVQTFLFKPFSRAELFAALQQVRRPR